MSRSSRPANGAVELPASEPRYMQVQHAAANGGNLELQPLSKVSPQPL